MSENYTGISSDISKFILDILPRLFKKLLLGLLHELTPEFLRDLLSGFLRKILSKFFQFTASGILPETPFMILSISSSGNPPFFSYGILQKIQGFFQKLLPTFFYYFSRNSFEIPEETSKEILEKHGSSFRKNPAIPLKINFEILPQLLMNSLRIYCDILHKPTQVFFFIDSDKFLRYFPSAMEFRWVLSGSFRKKTSADISKETIKRISEKVLEDS